MQHICCTALRVELQAVPVTLFVFLQAPKLRMTLLLSSSFTAFAVKPTQLCTYKYIHVLISSVPTIQHHLMLYKHGLK